MSLVCLLPRTGRVIACALAGLALAWGAGALAQMSSDAAAEAPPDAPADLWLEDSASPATQAWVAARNAETERLLLADPRYTAERQRLLAQAGGEGGTRHDDYLNGGLVHRLQADAEHPLGQWQVMATSASAHRRLGAGWHTMLDLDALAAREGVRWTLPLWWKNPMCDTRIGLRCVLNLSPDGGDRTVLREFDLGTRRFVAGGFRIDTPARTYAHWVDAEHLLVASDFGPGSISAAGYARQARLWRRGTPHTAARLLFDAGDDAVLFIPHNFRDLRRGRTHFVAEVWHRTGGTPSWWWVDPAARTAAGERTAIAWQPPVDLVRYRGLAGIVDGRLIAMTAQPLAVHGQLGGLAAKGPAAAGADATPWPAGSLLALPLPPGWPQRGPAPGGGRIEPVFVPTPHEAVDPVFHLAVADDGLWLGVMRDVSGQLLRARRGAQGWERQAQPVPAFGAVRLLAGEVAPSAVLVKTESLLSPPQTTLRHGASLQVIEQARAGFDAAAAVTEQFFATSRDGTAVPYYVTRRPAPAGSAPAPAVLTAYGGFGISFLPAYLNAEFHTDLVAPLLQAGGVHVHANIRGGGEYGPAWHAAARRRLRERGLDDLIAVAEDVARRGLADGARLGFIGASNGGLLASAVAVRRPALFHAVVADVPITDLLRFHELFTGAVWIDEYGDPRDAGDRAVLRAWSPLHNLRAGVRYPQMLLTTSRSDDRVHPGHARRFAERLRQLGQPVWFHESSDTGHGAAAALDARAARRALETSFLLQALGLGARPN